MLFKIGNTDFSDYISELKTSYRTLLASSQTNAAGDTFIDVQNHKYTVTVTVRPMLNDIEMSNILLALEDSVTISFYDAKTKTTISDIVCTPDTPEPEIYTYINNVPLYKKLSLKFTQL